MTIHLAHDHVGISVTPDTLDATAQWYHDHLGYEVTQRFTVDGTPFAFLTAGSSRLELMAYATRTQGTIPDDITRTMDPARYQHVCLRVADVDATLAELAVGGVLPIGGPHDVEVIGQRFAFIVDNLGNVIELTQDIAPAAV